MTPAVALLLSSYANLMLAIAALFYVAYAVGHFKNIGWLATGSAGLGALGLLTSLVSQWIHPAAPTKTIDLSVVLSLICTITVIAYLIMEKWYDARTAGVYVMPIVAAAAIFQTLGGTSEPITAPHALGHVASTLTHLYVICSIASVGAFAWTALLGAFYLWHTARHQYIFARQTSNRIEFEMNRAATVGFLIFIVALILQNQFSGTVYVDEWGRYLHILNMIFVWLLYFIYLVLHQQFQWRGRFMAWYVIAAFLIYILFLPELRSGWPLIS